jgi:hypothetical protein
MGEAAGIDPPDPSRLKRELVPRLIQIAGDTGKGVEPVMRETILPALACAAIVDPRSHEKHHQSHGVQSHDFHKLAER